MVDLRLVLGLQAGESAEQLEEGQRRSQDALGAGDEVEGNGQRAAVLKVGEPEFGASKLPLHVRIILQEREREVRDVGQSLIHS